MARKMVRAVGWCLACLDALEAAGDAASMRGPWAELAAALQRLCGLSARGPRERLVQARRLLRGCVPALLAASSAQLQRPRSAEPAVSWLAAVALTRRSLGELLGQLERGATASETGTRPGALSRRLRQLRQGWKTPDPLRPAVGRHDALLAAVLWHCMRLAAGARAPERRRLVESCGLLLELRRRGHEPPRTGQRIPAPREVQGTLLAIAEDLAQGIRLALLRQILDTFTDTQSPLQRLCQAASTPPAGSSARHHESWHQSLQLYLSAFLEQAQQMRRVAHLVLVCSPRPQTGEDLEATLASLRRLEETVRQLFPPRFPGPGLEPGSKALQALLQAWANACESLLACFDDVLHIPEFLSVSVQEMTEHLHLFPAALRSGDSEEFCRHVAYLQGRATHIVQVMNRFVGQHRDPIFRNGLRVLIHQLTQSSRQLGTAAGRCSREHSPQHVRDVSVTAQNLICSAQSLREGLDGTNHPDILSPLRVQVSRFHRVGEKMCFLLPSLQDSLAPAWKCQRTLGLGESGSGISCPPSNYHCCPFITDSRLLPVPNPPTLTARGHQQQALPSVCTNLQKQMVAENTVHGVLAGKGLLGPEGMTVLQEIQALSPSVIGLSHHPHAKPDGFLEMSPQTSGRMGETRWALVAMAGDWYLLCQQLFRHGPEGDLQGNMAEFMELQQSLALLVHLAAKSGPVYLGKKEPDSTGHPEALLQIRGQLEEVAAHAKQLLGQVLASQNNQASGSWEKSIEDRCLLWSVAVQTLLQCMKRVYRAQGLFLLPLRQATKDQQGLQEGLAQIAQVSQSLQKAARLSSWLCGEKGVQGELCFLAREIQVLTDALTEVAQILAMSPGPSPSLSTRFELLCLELILRVQALTSHLSTINVHYERVLQDALRPSLSVCKESQVSSESSLEAIVSGFQAVWRMVATDQESEPGMDDLLAALKDILTITQAMARGVSVPQQHPEEWGMLVDWLQWEWAAKAHHAVAQLRTWKGGHTEAWRLLTQCLKLSDEPAQTSEQDSAQLQPSCGEDATGSAADTVHSPGAAPEGPLGSPVLACSASPAIPEAAAADLSTVSEPASSSSDTSSTKVSSASYQVIKVPA